MKPFRAPSHIACGDRVVPVKRRRVVKLDGEVVRGTFGTNGIEIEIGPEELGTTRHETGHLAFYVCGLTEEWKKRLGADLAHQLEEDVMEKFSPLFVDILIRNGLL